VANICAYRGWEVSELQVTTRQAGRNDSMMTSQCCSFMNTFVLCYKQLCLPAQALWQASQPRPAVTTAKRLTW
jgi:hypothetical protein